MRLARLAAELGFVIEGATAGAAEASAPELPRVAAERVFSELRLLICCRAAIRGLSLLEELGAAAAVLPELVALHDVQQSDYHHLDVHGHTLEVLQRTIELTADPGSVFPEQTAELTAILGEPLANEMTRGQAMRIGAILHDAAKPATRAVSPEGRITFMGHDRARSRAHRRRARAAARERPAHPLRPGSGAPASEARLPRPRRAALTARRLPLPVRMRAGGGGGHPAERRRSARDARPSGAARRSHAISNSRGS